MCGLHFKTETCNKKHDLADLAHLSHTQGRRQKYKLGGGVKVKSKNLPLIRI